MQHGQGGKSSTASLTYSGDNPSSQRDTVASEVAKWIEEKVATDALVERWQRLEHSLSLQAKASGIAFEKVVSGPSRGARDLRALTRQISRADQRLWRAAQAIQARPNRSPADAVAKIRLAVRLHAPAENDLPWELIRSALGGLIPVEDDRR